jgi:hypothetical protein
MAKSILLGKKDISEKLQRKYDSSRRTWLECKGEWPISFRLGIPSEKEAHEQIKEVKVWQQFWHNWTGAGEIDWVERHWQVLGTQRLPERITIRTPEQVASWIGESERWDRVKKRRDVMVSKWPTLGESISKYYDDLADYTDTDFDRLLNVLVWLFEHPKSSLYIRQLPIRGIDTKWLENRRGIVTGLLRSLRPEIDKDADFFNVTGIRKLPQVVRMCILDPACRSAFGGLRDITVPVEDIATLKLSLKAVFIVENQQNGLAFGDIPGALVFMRMGNAVDVYGAIHWMRDIPCFYWGDMDTAGFAILNRLRTYHPHVKSFLMDLKTLTDHKDLWSHEKDPKRATLPLLAPEEQKAYESILSNKLGDYVRLEQERIPWQRAWETINSLM